MMRELLANYLGIRHIIECTSVLLSFRCQNQYVELVILIFALGQQTNLMLDIVNYCVFPRDFAYFNRNADMSCIQTRPYLPLYLEKPSKKSIK